MLSVTSVEEKDVANIKDEVVFEDRLLPVNTPRF